MKLQEFSSLDFSDMKNELIACCHCESWADRVCRSAPFDSLEQLLAVAVDCWQSATEEERLEAFSGHPQIGDLTALRSKFAATAGSEQGQVAGANEETLLALKSANETYLEKFGFIFVVCATGKSAEEMLGLVNKRLANQRHVELQNGADEQGKITEIRIRKRIEESS